MSEFLYPSPAELDIALATAVARALSAAVTNKGAATLVVSGGSTPKGLFSQLAALPLEWSKITVLLADERWVPTDHPDSNEKMVRALLLGDKAVSANFISLVADFPNETLNLQRVSNTLLGIDEFDVVILGMGGDGHTASLFPCCKEIAEGLSTTDPALMTHPETAPHARVTLSRNRLLQATMGLVHIVGGDKFEVLQRAQSADSLHQAPISAFIPPRGSFDVWYAPKS